MVLGGVEHKNGFAVVVFEEPAQNLAIGFRILRLVGGDDSLNFVLLQRTFKCSMPEQEEHEKPTKEEPVEDCVFHDVLLAKVLALRLFQRTRINMPIGNKTIAAPRSSLGQIRPMNFLAVLIPT